MTDMGERLSTLVGWPWVGDGGGVAVTMDRCFSRIDSSRSGNTTHSNTHGLYNHTTIYILYSMYTIHTPAHFFTNSATTGQVVRRSSQVS